MSTRAAALHLLADCDAAGIGATLSLGSEATSHKASLLVYDHYADPTPIFRRMTDVTWHTTDKGDRVVAFLDGKIDGVDIGWNGSPAAAEQIRASLGAEVPAHV